MTDVTSLSGPLNPDSQQQISTANLLSAIQTHGLSWPAQLAHHDLEAIARAVRREITALNLSDGEHLTEQGRETLAGLVLHLHPADALPPHARPSFVGDPGCV